MPDYTESDLKALHDLMIFGGRGQDSGPMAESRQPAPPVNYTKSDVNQFDDLMKFGTPAMRVPPEHKRWEPQPVAACAPEPEKPGAKPAPDGNTYTAADLRQFDRLLSPLPRDLRALSMLEHDGENAPLLHGGRSYAAQDLDAFRSLMDFSPDKAPEPSASGPAGAEPRHSRPRPHGASTRPLPMKIVDSDKEREQQRSNRQGGKFAIKIVYSSAGGGIS